MSINKWGKLSSRVVYKNPWYQIREDSVITPSGERGTYNVVEKKSSVFIIAVTDNKEVYLIDQYRYPTQMESWEVPSGGVEDNENLQESAIRELQEEAGIYAKNWTDLGIIQVENGVSNAIGYVFLATDLRQADRHKQEEEGIDNIKLIPFKDIFEMIKDERITDSQSISAIIKAALYLDIIA
ncbi:MAG: NUDIX hydrolase [Patescibacteria group bacterium]|nr:NUDIX hydrolase [Patescibacteria group bacterium]